MGAAGLGEALIIVALDLVGQVLELVEMRGATMQLPADFLQAVHIEIDRGERMADAAGLALAVAPDATVYVPAEQPKTTHHSRICGPRQNPLSCREVQAPPSRRAATDLATSGIDAMPS